jgi:hypothetical protein
MKEKVKFGYLSVIVIIQPECPKQVQPVCVFYFSAMVSAGLVSGRSGDNAFGINARLSLDGREASAQGPCVSMFHLTEN